MLTPLWGKVFLDSKLKILQTRMPIWLKLNRFKHKLKSKLFQKKKIFQKIFPDPICKKTQGIDSATQN